MWSESNWVPVVDHRLSPPTHPFFHTLMINRMGSPVKSFNRPSQARNWNGTSEVPSGSKCLTRARIPIMTGKMPPTLSTTVKWSTPCHSTLTSLKTKAPQSKSTTTQRLSSPWLLQTNKACCLQSPSCRSTRKPKTVTASALHLHSLISRGLSWAVKYCVKVTRVTSHAHFPKTSKWLCRKTRVVLQLNKIELLAHHLLLIRQFRFKKQESDSHSSPTIHDLSTLTKTPLGQNQGRELKPMRL